MSLKANNIRKDNVIKKKSGKSDKPERSEDKRIMWHVISTNHIKPGKGPAYVQIKMKNISEGSIVEERFRADDSVEKIDTRSISHTFLYQINDDCIFSNNDTYEEVTLNKSHIESAEFLSENMQVDILFFDGVPFSVTLPEHIVCEIAEADPVVKGQTAASSKKTAVLTNGIKIQVPVHIDQGMKVKVSSITKEYVTRV